MVLCDNDGEQDEEQQPIMVGGSGSLPPAYLQVPDFESCLGTKDVGSYSIVCLPVEMPDGCAGESWAALGSEDMPMVLCDNDDEQEEEQQPIMVGGSGSLPPAYLQVPDFESCLGSETSNDGSSEMW